MNTKKKYMIMLIACIVMCAMIVTVNFIEYKESKELVVNELYPDRTSVVSAVPKDTEEPKRENTININTATAQELSAFLPGIGEVKAENIVAYREAIGGFKSVEELIEVNGIGEATLNNIRSYCRISDD